MSGTEIKPERITKPIQLLAAWLAGLAIVDGAFLTAAANIGKPDWIAGALVVAAILNVPIFLFSLFLLQTKFRPEMQEDSYYSQYLERRHSMRDEHSVLQRTMTMTDRVESLAGKLAQQAEEIGRVAEDRVAIESAFQETLTDHEINELADQYEDSQALRYLTTSPPTWNAFSKKWAGNRGFDAELKDMLFDGLAEWPGESDLSNVLPTGLGKRVYQRILDRKKR